MRLGTYTAGPRRFQGNTGTALESKRLHRHVAILPAHEETAYHLGTRELIALSTAWRTREGWRVEAQYQAELAREGLCEMRGPYLTAYGMAVRRVAMREDA